MLFKNLKVPYESEISPEYTKFIENLNNIYSFHAGNYPLFRIIFINYYFILITFINIILFYAIGVIVHRVFNSSNSLIPYARIYKCGNEAVGANLDEISSGSKTSPQSANRFDNIRSQSQLESITASMVLH
jgi:hypothetical protein